VLVTRSIRKASQKIVFVRAISSPKLTHGHFLGGRNYRHTVSGMNRGKSLFKSGGRTGGAPGWTKVTGWCDPGPGE